MALEFSGSIAVGPHWGLESEFVYVPVRLDSTALATQAQRKSSQMTLLAGLRFTTKQPTAGKPALAVSFRGGFARIAHGRKASPPREDGSVAPSTRLKMRSSSESKSKGQPTRLLPSPLG